MYIETKTLPDFVRSALAEVDFHSHDISVSARKTYSVGDAGGAGRKSFCIVIDGQTGRRVIHWGSWGGPNMFNPGNQVDLDSAVYPLPVDGIVIHGSIGNQTYASISVNPANVAKFLPVAENLSDRERSILFCYSHIRSGGNYRKDALNKLRPTDAEYASLIARGFLSQNKAGRKVTTKGKNVDMKWDPHLIFT